MPGPCARKTHNPFLLFSLDHCMLSILDKASFVSVSVWCLQASVQHTLRYLLGRCSSADFAALANVIFRKLHWPNQAVEIVFVRAFWSITQIKEHLIHGMVLWCGKSARPQLKALYVRILRVYIYIYITSEIAMVAMGRFLASSAGWKIGIFHLQW